MISPKRSFIAIFLASFLLLALGAIGGYFAGNFWPYLSSDVTLESDDEPQANGGMGSVVEISETTMNYMNLVTSSLELKDFEETVGVPAKVVERLPIGRQYVSAPITSRVKDVLISPGQSVRPGDPMFVLEITDQELSQAQVELLAARTEINIIKDRVARLEPLAKTGAVKSVRLYEERLE